MPAPSNNPLDTVTPDGLPNGTPAAPSVSTAAPADSGSIANAEVVDNGAVTSPDITSHDQTEVNFADFEAAGATVKPNAPIEPAPAAKVAKTPEEIQKESEVDHAAVNLATVVKSVVPAAATPAVRDYNVLPPEIRDHAKKMSNEAFNATTNYVNKIVAENATAKQQIEDLKKGKIPDSYLEHPEAFVLTPEFAQATRAANDSNVILSHWENQLNEVRAGATEYKPLVRGQDGQMYYGAPVKADATTEILMLKMFNAAQQQAYKYNGNVESIKTSFAEKHNEAKKWLSGMEQASYQVFNDEKNPMHAAYKQALEQFPATYRANPLASMLAKSMVANGQLMQMVQQLQSSKTGTTSAATVVATQRKAAGPNLNDIGGDGSGTAKAGDNITFDDFKKAMW